MARIIILVSVFITFNSSVFSQIKFFIPEHIESFIVEKPKLKVRYPVYMNDTFTCYLFVQTPKGKSQLEVYKNNQIVMKCEYAEGDVLCKEASLVEDVVTGKYKIAYRNYYFAKLITVTDYSLGKKGRVFTLEYK